jgi:tRNA G10  N-methylase Trm11
MTTTAQVIPDHPATYSKTVLDRFREVLVDHVALHGPIRVLDPNAGTGGVHELAQAGTIETVGLELQPEWAAAHPDTIVGDATAMPFATGEFSAGVCSFCYGNRMADHHHAKDPCKEGQRVKEGEQPVGSCVHGVFVYADGRPPVTCPGCKGSGLSKRNSYAHALRRSGVEPVASPTNAQLSRWGPGYRQLHEAMLDEWLRVIEPGGLVVVNMSNHLETLKVQGEKVQVEHRVVEWWVNQLLVRGCRLDEVRRVATRRNRQGTNRDARVVGEVVMVAYNRSPRWR